MSGEERPEAERKVKTLAGETIWQLGKADLNHDENGHTHYGQMTGCQPQKEEKEKVLGTVLSDRVSSYFIIDYTVYVSSN